MQHIYISCFEWFHHKCINYPERKYRRCECRVSLSLSVQMIIFVEILFTRFRFSFTLAIRRVRECLERKSRKVALKCLATNLRYQELATTANRVSGIANFRRRIKTREKWSMQIYSDERAQSLKVLRIGRSGRVAVKGEAGCRKMEKRRTCICTGKLNIHTVQIRPSSDSFYRLLLLQSTSRFSQVSVCDAARISGVINENPVRCHENILVIPSRKTSNCDHLTLHDELISRNID